MSGSATARRRGRGAQPDGPRATFRQLLPFLFEHKRTLIVVAVLSVVGAATSLVQPLLVGQVIEAVQSDAGIGILVWLLVGFVIVSSIISGFQHYLLQRTGTAVVYSSRRKLIARILHLPTSEFDARRTGDLVSRVGTDTTLLYAVLTQGLADAVGSAVLFLGALIAMLVIDPVLLLMIVLVIGLSVTVVVLLSGRIRTASTAQQMKVGELASGVERAIGSIRTIRASGATEREADTVTTLASETYGIGVRIAKISSLVVPVSGIALQLSLLVVLGVGGFRVAAGAITIASLISFIMFLFLLVMPLATTFGAITSVNQALGALGRIQEVLDLPTESQDDEKIAASLPREAAAADAPAIEFRDVRFHYPANVVAARQAAAKEARSLLADAHLESTEDAADAPQDHEVLRGVSFAVPHGSRVALVGPSGAGKSTILSLIERFYDPTGGSIRVHGHDARTYPRDDLRAHFGYVEQDAPTLAGTLAENLRLASPNATDADCERVLRAVNLGDVLERNPLGIEAPVGEDGVMLSGGERQRLAIARALLTDAPILLLDESTSSLDGVNEQRMREAIDAVSTDRTLIVIAHRLSTVVDSDLIVVLQDGVVVGQGTHAELVESTPLYRDLARHQLLA
ncbi:ABC transporter ATP-binding protein [Microbacterium aurugineum]|uniref:ABC transporter ATP-binding protein/permease n=1 Tax=Microbacterium aurugineum TaxID=2851642 RepID=A0ABY4J2P9_9MICO|nr:ABC transporter ATP-binding protein [Microbacterium aurugineum]UPL18321.1 ABC transporter ATP-binding protein/permease [Microbacterium aurugineum]